MEAAAAGKKQPIQQHFPIMLKTSAPMINIARNLSLRLAHSLVFLLLASCSTIATFDQTAYDKTTGAKAEALALMNKATGSYSAHAKEIEAVSLTIDKAYEYDRGRALNTLTVQQWEILRDPNKNLFGGFLRRWHDKGSLKPDYITEKKPDIAEAFDQITLFEIGKRKNN